jgi:hypothetical protein
MKKVLLALGIVLAVLPACDTGEDGLNCNDKGNYCQCFPENCIVVGDEPADVTVAPGSPAKGTR